VERDARHALAPDELLQGGQMRHVGVDAAGRQEADEVERSTSVAGLRARAQQRGVLEEGAAPYRLVDDVETLRLDVAGADREVTDLAVAHDPGREPDRRAARVERRMRVAREQRVQARRIRACGDVAGTFRRDPPPVEHAQDDGAERQRKARTIAAKSSGFSDAPPTSAPSMPSADANSATPAAVTLPP
jgi:hypothetical protein